MIPHCVSEGHSATTDNSPNFGGLTQKFISHSHRIHGSLGSVETMGGLKDLGLFSNGFITPQSTKEKNLKGISFLSIFNFF